MTAQGGEVGYELYRKGVRKCGASANRARGGEEGKRRGREGRGSARGVGRSERANEGGWDGRGGRISAGERTGPKGMVLKFYGCTA